MAVDPPSVAIRMSVSVSGARIPSAVDRVVILSPIRRAWPYPQHLRIRRFFASRGRAQYERRSAGALPMAPIDFVVRAAAS